MFITDPSVMKDTWRLTEGFVAEEGKALLPHMAKIRYNLTETSLSLHSYRSICKYSQTPPNLLGTNFCVGIERCLVYTG